MTLSRLETLRFVRGGSFTRISAVGGSVTVRNTALESVSFLLSLGVVNGDLNVGEGCPDLASLDGLQNLRRVAGATRIAPASLRGNFGRCGAVSSDRGVTHTCYARAFRVCVPLFPRHGNENENDASFESIGATPRARDDRSRMVPVRRHAGDGARRDARVAHERRGVRRRRADGRAARATSGRHALLRRRTSPGSEPSGASAACWRAPGRGPPGKTAFAPSRSRTSSPGPGVCSRSKTGNC